MYKKIDIYINGQYLCSTNKAKSLEEAKKNFLNNPVYMGIDGITRVKNISRISCQWAK